MAAVLPLIVLVMFLVWGIKPRTDDIRTAVSADGIWVLDDTELMQTAVRLTGDVEYVPNALLTPQEFEGRTDIRIGQPGNEIQYATSRIRIRIFPGSYLICGYSVDFASRMYVNGKLLFEAGVPGDSRETTVPGVKYYQLPVSPDADGEIVIVQQASNFTHKDGGTHGTLYIGMPEWINRYTFRNLWPEVILMGCYLVLFPGVLPKWFPPAASLACAGFAGIDLFGSTLLISYTAVWRIVLLAGIALHFFIRLFLCWKKPGAAQLSVLLGFAFLLAAALWDMLYHRDILLLPALRFSISEMAMAVFVLFAMTAMFFGTMQEVRQAREREESIAAEKEMLEEMNRLKNQFYTDVSHEMKTPLTVISVNAQFAAQNIRAGMVDEETVMDLTAISAEARRLAGMVTSLVGLGRIQGAAEGRGVLALDSLVLETVRIYQSMFKQKENILTAEVDPDLPSVEGDAGQLVQVLINLLSNANKHTGKGRVSVRVENLGKQLRVSVADNGDGISPELLPHVFERFRRGGEGGAGLGLTICRTIIEEHGGMIGAESAEGEGTRIWFTLPVKEGAEHE